MTAIYDHLLRKTRNEILNWRINLKWCRDKQALPLTSSHRELYEIIHRFCFGHLGYFPNLSQCRDFNDKMHWLQLFDQRVETVQCTDKLGVRDYVEKLVGTKYLLPVFQIADNFDGLIFEKLPSSFVLKTNHDSGSVVIIKNKYEFDLKGAQIKFENALKRAFGWTHGEWSYSYIVPKIFAEKLIDTKDEVPPPDYKFHCVEGEVRFCQYIFDRGVATKEQIVDRYGIDLITHLDPNFRRVIGFARPECWEEMISLAECLSANFKYVRVDLYCSGRNIYVGEMTFWPYAGIYPGNGQKVLSHLIDFDRTTYKPLVQPELENKLSRFKLYQLF
jgi:hypothetical protein